ncbi:MAG TPA: endonuclease/exonuclease/phosphatase family protein [Kofleriaceae bacterium]|nr:endonuclease/exonuclease/phosphatase family protein [Kofleriaceae bacterium]
MQRLRVATFNLWNRQGPWAQRLPLIRAGLAALDADVIGLQEVLGFPGHPSQADEVAPAGWHVHHAPAWEVGGGLTFGNAIVSRHPLRDPAILPLPAPPGLDTRTVAFARVDVPGGPVPVFVTHLTHQLHLGHVRCTQVRALAEHVRALAPIDLPPPVLLGDFNADPDADEMRFLRGLCTLGGESVYFADAWAATEGHGDAAAPRGPGHTYDRRNTYALRTREPSRRIDYIYVRGPDRHLRGEPLAAWLALDQPTDGVWPSDHFAVVADVQLAVRGHDPW